MPVPMQWPALSEPSDLPQPTVRSPIALLRVWMRRVKSRHELALLDAVQMRDAGLNADAVKRESRKFFWQA